MKWLPMTLFIALSSVVAAYSGTFLDDFSDGDLDGWHIFMAPEPFIPNLVRLEDGYLVMDTRVGKNDNPAILKILFLELEKGNAKNWDSYTLTCRVRIAEVSLGYNPSFNISVRSREGHFDVMTDQQMFILPTQDLVGVVTFPPDAKIAPDGVDGVIHRENFETAIKLRRWYQIKIVAKESKFEFHFNGNRVSKYKDDTAGPGTVRFQAVTGILVHLDDVVITGPDIPNFGGPHSVSPEALLATTWGAIKNLSRK